MSGGLTSFAIWAPSRFGVAAAVLSGSWQIRPWMTAAGDGGSYNALQLFSHSIKSNAQ